MFGRQIGDIVGRGAGQGRQILIFHRRDGRPSGRGSQLIADAVRNCDVNIRSGHQDTSSHSTSSMCFSATKLDTSLAMHLRAGIATRTSLSMKLDSGPSVTAFDEINFLPNLKKGLQPLHATTLILSEKTV